MNDDIIRQFTPEQTAKMRDDILRHQFAPFIGKVFADHPALNSALLSVAQYWCDEAWDAVHGELSYSLHRDPDIDVFYARIRADAESESMDDDAYFSTLFIEGGETADALNFPAAPPPKPQSFLDRLLGRKPVYINAVYQRQNEITKKLSYDVFWGRGRKGGWIWDNNGEAIPLFAAFCHEEGNQEESFAANYTPYAIFRRSAQSGAPAELEVIGTMRRPWLDGVGPREFDELYPKGES